MSCQPSDFVCIVNNCSGGTGNQRLIGVALFNYWAENNCPAAYSEAINTSPTGFLAYNPAQQLAMQGKVVDLFNTYFITNQLTDDVTSPAFDPFQFTLLDLCIDPTLPGICNQFLTSFCSQICAEESTTQSCRTRVANSPTLTNFCGCYVPPDPDYLRFTLASPGCLIGATGCTAGCTAGNTGCTGQPACDPLCHRALTSHKAFQPTGAIITCPQNVCVIDDVVINATQTDIRGGINFNTVCSGCGGGSGSAGCLCVVSGVNVSETFAQIGIGTNFNEFCGGSSVCLVEDDAGNIISEGGCTGINPLNIQTQSYFLPVLGIVAILLISVLIVLFVSIAARTS